MFLQTRTIITNNNVIFFQKTRLIIIQSPTATQVSYYTAGQSISERRSFERRS